MAPSMERLAADLADEWAALRALLEHRREDDWRTATPAVPWTVRDQITHLAYYDDLLAASLPGAPVTAPTTPPDPGDPDAVAAHHATLTGPAALAWADEARGRLTALLAALPADARVPWMGLSMSAASAATARIMETWAHGQDVADALHASRTATHRLRHVAHLAYLARPFSYQAHGLPAPAAPVRVELTAPGGELWTWGPPDAPDRVTGGAGDFCLVTTRRRHRRDTALTATAGAARWLDVAQTYAGPPGTGRAPTGG